MNPVLAHLLARNLPGLIGGLAIVLCMVALYESHQSRLISQNPIIIAIDQNGTRLVEKSNDPIFESEVISFSRAFLGNLYNFSPQTFMKNVGYSSGLMAEKLWAREEGRIQNLMNQVKESGITLKSTVEKISELESGKYLALLRTTQTSRLNVENRRISVKFSLVRVPRTPTNPWGIEVSEHEEQSAL